METFWKEPYALDTSHLAGMPIHFLLNYKKKTEAEAGRLRRALKANNPRPATKPAPRYEMHEFPFNKTDQADENLSSVEYVDAAQNSLQGVYFSWFIRKKLESRDGAPFIVVPIPDVVLPD